MHARLSFVYSRYLHKKTLFPASLLYKCAENDILSSLYETFIYKMLEKNLIKIKCHIFLTPFTIFFTTIHLMKKIMFVTSNINVMNCKCMVVYYYCNKNRTMKLLKLGRCLNFYTFLKKYSIL